MPKLVKKDITSSQDDYIIQQCNCLTITAHGLAQTLLDAFPYANVYGRRKRLGSRNCATTETRDIPGTFHVFRKSEKPAVVALFAQWCPGKLPSRYEYPPLPSDLEKETYKKRLVWFRKSLYALGEHLEKYHGDNEHVSIAIPYKIGCGLAGGNWTEYERILKEFEIDYKHLLSLTIYKL